MEEDSPALKIASMHRYNELHKKRGGRLITAFRNNTDNTSINRTKIIRKQKWKEKNCMDISCDKQAKSHKRKLGRG